MTIETTNLISQLEPLLPSAVATLRDYLAADDGTRAQRDKAKLALNMVNTAITLQRSIWSQQRHEVNIARTLSDGDLDLLQSYVATVNPGLQIRKIVIEAAKE